MLHNTDMRFCSYFSALTNGEPLPIKKRLEPAAMGLSPGLLEVLYQQLKNKDMIGYQEMAKKWFDLGLPKETMGEIMKAGGFAQEFEFAKFFAVAASHLGGRVSTLMFVHVLEINCN